MKIPSAQYMIKVGAIALVTLMMWNRFAPPTWQAFVAGNSGTSTDQG